MPPAHSPRPWHATMLSSLWRPSWRCQHSLTASLYASAVANMWEQVRSLAWRFATDPAQLVACSSCAHVARTLRPVRSYHDRASRVAVLPCRTQRGRNRPRGNHRIAAYGGEPLQDGTGATQGALATLVSPGGSAHTASRRMAQAISTASSDSSPLIFSRWPLWCGGSRDAHVFSDSSRCPG
jgi:hypothetical protein